MCELEGNRWKGKQGVEVVKAGVFKYLGLNIQSNRRC